MGVVHISEEEAVRDFTAVLAKLDAADAVIIDRSGCSVQLNRAARIRTVAEVVAILKSLPGERGYMDEEYAKDVRSFRERHPEGLDGSKRD